MKVCPICMGELERHWDHDGYRTLEESVRCPVGHYSYEFADGTEQWRLGCKLFGISWADNMRVSRKVDAVGRYGQ